MVGSVILDDLTSILLRFRKHPIDLVADVAKMYRRVLIHPHDNIKIFVARKAYWFS